MFPQLEKQWKCFDFLSYVSTAKLLANSWLFTHLVVMEKHRNLFELPFQPLGQTFAQYLLSFSSFFWSLLTKEGNICLFSS